MGGEARSRTILTGEPIRGRRSRHGRPVSAGRFLVGGADPDLSLRARRRTARDGRGFQGIRGGRAPFDEALLPRMPLDRGAGGRPRPRTVHPIGRSAKRASRLAAGRRDARSRRDAPEGGPPARRGRTGPAQEMGRRLPLDRGDPACRRPRKGGPPSPEQRRIYLYDPRPDGPRRARAGPRVPRRWRGGRGVHQHRQRAGDVAVAPDEVPGRGQGGRRSRGALARRLPILAPDDLARLDRGDSGEDPRILSRVHRPSRRRRPRQPPGDRLRHQPGRSVAARTLPRGDDRRASSLDFGGEERGRRGGRTRAERPVSRHALEEPHRPRAFAPARRPPGPLEGREARRRPGTRRRGRRLAEGALEILQRRPHRQEGRPQGVDGAGQPAGREPAGPVQDSALDRWPGRDALPRRDRRRGRQRA